MKPSVSANVTSASCGTSIACVVEILRFVLPKFLWPSPTNTPPHQPSVRGLCSTTSSRVWYTRRHGYTQRPPTLANPQGAMEALETAIARDSACDSAPGERAPRRLEIRFSQTLFSTSHIIHLGTSGDSDYSGFNFTGPLAAAWLAIITELP